MLANSLMLLLREYSPRLVVAELPVGGGKSARAAIQMGMSAAIVAATCHILGYPLAITTPMQGKRVVGKGVIDKKAVQRWVIQNFDVRLPERAEIREHVADAMIALEACSRHHKEGACIHGQ
jgi:Holliday junction resolvasome RuvABC endonuclease subunit